MYKSNLANCVAMMRNAATAATTEAADVFVVALRLGLGGPSPSSPGNMPGLRSGSLQRSIWAVPFRQSADESETLVSINPNAAGPGKTPPWLYGIFLEGGTVKMAPRPFFGPVSRNYSIQAAAFNRATIAARKAFQ